MMDAFNVQALADLLTPKDDIDLDSDEDLVSFPAITDFT